MTITTPLPFTTATALSADGTEIAYRSLGAGPGLVVVHGSMQSALSQIDLARLLAVHGTVHLIERRGRGGSGAYPAGVIDSGVVTDTEVADLRAVLDATGSDSALGVSSGALIAARAALVTKALRRIVLFEPPLVDRGSIDLDFVVRFDAESAAGDTAAAMVTGMRGAQMGPGFMAAVPRPILAAMSRRMLARDAASPAGDGHVPLQTLAELLRYDFAVVTENAETATEFAAVRADALLLTGSRTRPYLTAGTEAMAAQLPNARLEVLPGTNHGATQNTSDWGRPAIVADAIQDFLVRSAGRD